MMVSGVDTLSAERFNQQLCCNTAQYVEEESHNYSAEPKPDVLQEMPTSPSEKKKFLGNILRRSSDKVAEKQDKRRNSTGIFSNIFKKSGDVDLRKSGEMAGSPSSSSSLRRSKENVESDAYLMNLKAMEGRTDEEIAQFLSAQEEPQGVPTLASPPSSRKKNSSFSAFFSSVHQALKEEFSVKREDYFYPALPDTIPDHTRELTVSISAAPFFAAPPPETDMSFAELATYEPVYTNGDGCCINNLPVHKHDGTPLPGDQTTCSICISAFEKKEDLKSLPCVHFFHKECIDRWLMVGHKCPVCKTLVL